MIYASGELFYVVIALDSNLGLRFCGVPLLVLVNSTIELLRSMQECMLLS